MASLDSWFMALPEHFNADSAGSLKAVYFFDVTGEGGGQYTVTVADRACTVDKAKPQRADLTVTLAAPDMTAIAAGELDPTTAFMTGRLRVDGDIALAMQLSDLFLRR